MKQLGRYTILEAVGEGGMAEVFRARLDGPMGFQKTLAIKRIRNVGGSRQGEQARALINEARIGGRLRHPNIVEVYELAEEKDDFYLVMEFVDGETVSSMLDSARATGKRLPPNVALDIAIQCCHGLAYAHQFRGEDGESLQLVHRDLKPGNLMVTPAGVVKIMDFGIAKASTNLFDTTDTNVAKGTPLYMSPEQLKGQRPLGPPSDLWALGVLLYELATGRILFRGRTVPEIITRVLNQPLALSIEQAERGLRGVGPILTRLLERDRTRRYQDAMDVAAALEGLRDWVDEVCDTGTFVRAFRDGAAPFVPPPNLEPPAPTPGTGAEMEALADDGEGAAPVHEFIGEVRGRKRVRRLIGAGLLLVLVALGAYVVRGTLGTDRAMVLASEAVRSGDLERARLAFGEALAGHGGHHDARRGWALTSLWTGARPADVIRELERLPEETGPQFVLKYRAVAATLRRDGDYEGAFRYLRLAVDHAAPAGADGGERVPPALLWEMAEAAIVVAGDPERAQAVGAQDLGRTAWQRLVDEHEGTVDAEGARAWLAALDDGGEALMRAEVLYQDGRSRKAWDHVLTGLTALTPAGGALVRERMVWVYRALGDGRWDAVAPLLPPVPKGPEEQGVQFSRLVAEAASLAGLAQPEPARKALKQALKVARNADERALVRLQVALALKRAALDASWADTLLRDAAGEIGREDDPDIVMIRGAKAGVLPTEGALLADPRSGRLFPAGLRRGAPFGAHLVPTDLTSEANRSALGAPWPLGPSFHPLDGTRMVFRVEPRW